MYPVISVYNFKLICFIQANRITVVCQQSAFFQGVKEAAVGGFFQIDVLYCEI